jgi:hypothetical protein
MEGKNRWWDYYYVRYFVGAIVGAVILVVAIRTNRNIWPQLHEWLGHELLRGAFNLKIIDESTVSAIETLAALGTVGLAYCYLASAPVLLLHSSRERMGRHPQTYDRVRRVIVILTVVVSLLMSFALFFPESAQTLESHCWQFIPAVSVMPYLGIFALQIYLLLPKRTLETGRYYLTLAKMRSRAMTPDKGVRAGSEFIESYRHLREHGNALLIILLEGILALALSEAPSLTCFALMIAAWILPATFAWFLGTYLETNLDEI